MIYLNNASITFPKPSVVIDSVYKCLNNYCINPGRSSRKLTIEVSRLIFETREKIAEFFCINDSSKVVFL